MTARVIKEVHPVHGVSYNVLLEAKTTKAGFWPWSKRAAKKEVEWQTVGVYPKMQPALDHYELLMGRKEITVEVLKDSDDE